MRFVGGPAGPKICVGGPQLILITVPTDTPFTGCLLAPTGALVLTMVYDISIYPATFSDFEHLCLSILLQVSL